MVCVSSLSSEADGHLLLTATSLLVHLSWGLPAAFPTYLWPPCLLFPTASSTAPTTVGKLKWQRKAPPGLFFSEVPPPRKQSPSFPRSSLALYKETNHKTGNKQIKAATVHHGENKGLAESCSTCQGCQCCQSSCFLAPTAHLCGWSPSTDTKQMNSWMHKSTPKQRALVRFPGLSWVIFSRNIQLENIIREKGS